MIPLTLIPAALSCLACSHGPGRNPHRALGSPLQVDTPNTVQQQEKKKDIYNPTNKAGTKSASPYCTHAKGHPSSTTNNNNRSAANLPATDACPEDQSQTDIPGLFQEHRPAKGFSPHCYPQEYIHSLQNPKVRFVEQIPQSRPTFEEKKKQLQDPPPPGYLVW